MISIVPSGASAERWCLDRIASTEGTIGDRPDADSIEDHQRLPSIMAWPTTSYLVAWNGHGDALGLGKSTATAAFLSRTATSTRPGAHRHRPWHQSSRRVPCSRVATGQLVGHPSANSRIAYQYVGASDDRWLVCVRLIRVSGVPGRARRPRAFARAHRGAPERTTRCGPSAVPDRRGRPPATSRLQP